MIRTPVPNADDAKEPLVSKVLGPLLVEGADDANEPSMSEGFDVADANFAKEPSEVSTVLGSLLVEGAEVAEETEGVSLRRRFDTHANACSIFSRSA